MLVGDQVALFDRCAIGLPSAVPTAKHVLAAGQATPNSRLATAPVPLRLAWTLHDEPFQCSTSVRSLVALSKSPTAVQFVAAKQATAANKPLRTAGGRG